MPSYPCLVAQSILASQIHVSPSTWLLVHPAGHTEEMCVTAFLSGSPNGEPSDHTAELGERRAVYESPRHRAEHQYPWASGVVPIQKSMLSGCCSLICQTVPSVTGMFQKKGSHCKSWYRPSIDLYSCESHNNCRSLFIITVPN